MGMEMVELIFERVANRQVSDIMKQRAQADKASGWVVHAAVLPLAGRCPRLVSSEIRIDVLHDHLSHMNSANRVFKSRVCGAWENHVRKAQLPDTTKTLKSWMIDYRDLFGIQEYVPVHRKK
jgi:hypothetical protein